MLVFHPAMVNCYRSCKSRDKAINISYVTHTSSDVTITFKIGSVYVVLPSCKVWFWACKTRDKVNHCHLQSKVSGYWSKIISGLFYMSCRSRDKVMLVTRAIEDDVIVTCKVRSVHTGLPSCQVWLLCGIVEVEINH